MTQRNYEGSEIKEKLQNEDFWEKATDEEIISEIRKVNSAYINTKNNYGNTALMLASRYNENVEVTKALINAGADINAKGNDGWTALISASRYNINLEVIRALINAGADVNAEDNDGWTALVHAHIYNGNEKITQALIDAGPKIFVINDNEHDEVDLDDDLPF